MRIVFNMAVRMSALAVAGAMLLGACGTPARAGTRRPVHVVAAENFWGNIAAQLGGAHVVVRSIISDPAADPHLYESDARDAARVAGADVIILNGLGYDDAIKKLLSSTSRPGRRVLTAATGTNPHVWYDLTRVSAFAHTITDALTQLDPIDARDFANSLAIFDASLRPLRAAIETIKTEYRRAPVAYTERVPEYLVQAAGLTIRTPRGFAEAIEDGNEPDARDTKAMDDLINRHDIDVLLYNAQATSPATDHVRQLAQHARIPVVAVTETMPKHEPDYQQWQLDQIDALLTALS